MIVPKRIIKTKIPKLTPKQIRLLMLKEEAKKKRQELKELRAKIEPTRRAARKKEAAARKIENILNEDIKNKSNIVTDQDLEAIPAQVREDMIKEDVNIVFKPNPGPQTEFLAATEKEVFYGGARGGGKAGYVNDLVLTPFGWKRLGDVNIGDQISCPDGTVSKVLLVHPQGLQDIYTVRFDDGSECHVTLDHLWEIVRTSRSQKAKRDTGLGRLETTETILKNIQAKSTYYTIPLCSPVQYTLPKNKYTQKLFNPYLLGLLLGDGCLRQGQISFSTKDDEFFTYFISIGLDVIKNGTNIRFRKIDNLRNTLKELGVYDCLSNNKFVPEKYFIGSVQERFQLIRGLMDTDGTADRRGHCSYCTVSSQLAKDMQRLIWSIGGKATITTKETFYTNKANKKIKGQLAYILYIQTKDNSLLFNLPRKKDRCANKKFNGGVGRSELRRRINSIEYWKNAEAKCITIDHPRGLYITNDFIVTHNSYSLLVDPLRYCDKEQHRALILRRTMPELRDLISHSQRLYPKAFPGAKWREQEKEWKFPSGARIEFGYAENSTDALRYQGQAYTWIGVDELPQFPTDEVWTLLKGSLRSVDPTIPTFMRATGNPGNAGSLWVKAMFIDPAPANHSFLVKIDPLDPNSPTIARRYIPAKLDDNPYLLQTIDYRNMLLSLPEIKKKQWLLGSWETIEGAAFSEFDASIHVIEPFKIPENWPKIRSGDWGFSSPFCVLWGAIDYDNTLYIYREFYGKGLTADLFARKVSELEKGEWIQTKVLDSSVWARRGDIGPSIVEVMRNNGCLWKPSDRSPGSRKNGKMEVHRRLAIREEGELRFTKIKIFNTCRNLIRTLPMLPVDENDPEDIDTKSEDHAYDALRYMCMSRPLDPVSFDYYKQSLRSEQWAPADPKVGY